MEVIYDNLGTTLSVPKKEKPTKISYNPLYSLAELLSTSLGPNGKDKIIQTKDGEIIITNDGATILSNLNSNTLQFIEKNEDVEFKQSVNFILKLIIELSKAQDAEIGDGTTSVVILASALLKECEGLITKGIHPVKIINNLEICLKESIKMLNEMAQEINYEEAAISAARTSLNSKIVGFKQQIVKKRGGFFSSQMEEKNEKIAQICVQAINKIKSIDGQKDFNFDLIKIIKKPGASITETQFFDGLIVERAFAHMDMPKKQEGLIGLLTEPLEIPKLKTKHELGIKNAEDFENLCNFEKEIFEKIIKILKEKNIKVLLCQWGFEDEATSLLMENGISAVRWMGGTDMEMAAVCLNGKIASRIDEIEGVEGIIEEISFGTENEKILKINKKSETQKMCSILVRGTTKMSIDESERSIHDALCAVRNLNIDKKIVYGGGCAEFEVSKKLGEMDISSPENKIVFRAFADSLLSIPKTLIKNGNFPIDTLKEMSSTVGVGGNMKELEVFDTLKAKEHLWKCAVEVVTRILKCDEIIFTD